jgi:hypothetical protein
VQKTVVPTRQTGSRIHRPPDALLHNPLAGSRVLAVDHELLAVHAHDLHRVSVPAAADDPEARPL